MPPSSSSTFSWRRVSRVVMSEPQILDVDIAVDGHLAGQALIRRGTQALQEVAFLGPHLAALRETLRHVHPAGAAGARAAAEGDVGASGIGNALQGRSCRSLHQQILQE